MTNATQGGASFGNWQVQQKRSGKAAAHYWNSKDVAGLGSLGRNKGRQALSDC